MDSYVRRYVKEELTDKNAVHRAFLRNTGKFYSFLPIEEGVARADLWPELTDGKLENATNFNFMSALRSSRSRSPQVPLQHTSKSRRSNSLSEQRVRVISAHSRPIWNRDTRHVDFGEDPLMKCLRQSLQARGFDEDYEKAREEADSLRQVEAERLRKKLEEQARQEQRQEQRRALMGKWHEIFQLERAKRDVLTRGERTIRLKLVTEFHRTFTLVVELTEFNQRKRIFRLSLQQLDELKVSEREEFLERQMYEKLLKQREWETTKRQKEAQNIRRRSEELVVMVRPLIAEEVVERDKVVRWALQRWMEYTRQENIERDTLLRYEILDSVVYEESLQRQLFVDEWGTWMRNTMEARASAITSIEEHTLRAEAARQQSARAEQTLRRQHDIEQQKDFLRNEAISRSDISSAAFKSISSVIARFHMESLQRRLSEREARERFPIQSAELASRNSLTSTVLQLKAKALELNDIRVRAEVEQQRKDTLREKVERQNKPFLGVTLAERVDPPALLVESLFIDGPSDVAGVKIGDVFVSVGGHTVNNFADMRVAIQNSARMGERLDLTLLRDADRISTTVQVLTADKEFADLTDIYFDVEKHARLKKETSAPSTPEKLTGGTTPQITPVRTPRQHRSGSGASP